MKPKDAWGWDTLDAYASSEETEHCDAQNNASSVDIQPMRVGFNCRFAETRCPPTVKTTMLELLTVPTTQLKSTRRYATKALRECSTGRVIGLCVYLKHVGAPQRARFIRADRVRSREVISPRNVAMHHVESAKATEATDDVLGARRREEAVVVHASLCAEQVWLPAAVEKTHEDLAPRILERSADATLPMPIT